MDQQQQPVYAGFWMRFLAYIIDGILLGVACSIILVPLFLVMGVTAATGAGDQDMESGGAAVLMALMGSFMVIIVIAIVVAAWLYFALMESSAKQATLGKLAMGLRVTDLEGHRITFGRATGRHFGKIVSQIILYVGFIMAGFTQQKQALHDIMAGCLVVRK